MAKINGLLGVRVLDLKYRETGYATQPVGRFVCNDPQLNQLWREAERTLYVTMRDTYMDCPDRERAQWWGDAVNELGEAFYVFEPFDAPRLTRKAMYELSRWQRADDTLYSPIPSGVRRDGLLYPLDGSWDQELPRQMLASVGWYGFWTYYWYTGDRETIRDVYPTVKRYLSLWRLGDDGLVVHRAGGWDWTDWGEHCDVPIIENAWLYLALKGAAAMADVLGLETDAAGYRHQMETLATSFDAAFWRDDKYRSVGHQGPTDDRANAMAVVAGLVDPSRYEAVASVLNHERHASPYMEKYVLEALLLMDRPDEAFTRIMDRYAYMLGDDKTTLWEFFDPLHLEGVGDIGRGTYNHAWSGGPLTILSQYVAGVAPTAPAFAEYAVTPHPGRLTSIDSSTPTPHGPIDVRITRDQAAQLLIAVTSPKDTRGVAWLSKPCRGDEVRLKGGAVLWQDGVATVEGEASLVGERDGRLGWRLAPGGATLVVTSDSDADDVNTLSEDERRKGFVALFNGQSLEGWSHGGNWSVVDDAIYRAGDGGFLTYDRATMPDDFELCFQWKVAPHGNSGVYYRPGQYEYQILDNDGHSDGANPRTSAAALYFGVAPSHDATRPAGRWNSGRIICRGTVVQHWLNEEKVIDIDYADPLWKADLERLAMLGGDIGARGGRLSLQDHGDPVWYRAIKLRTLSPDEPLDDSRLEPAPMTANALEKENEIIRSIRSR